MPSKREQALDTLRSLGISVRPEGQPSRSQGLGMFDGPHTRFAPSLDDEDDLGLAMDRTIALPDRAPSPSDTLSGERRRSAPLLDDDGAFRSQSALDSSQPSGAFEGADLGSGRPTARDIRFAVSELEHKRNVAVAAAEEAGLGEARRDAIKSNYNKKIKRLNDMRPVGPDMKFDTPLDTAKSGWHWLTKTSVPGAEKVGDIIAGDTREGKRGVLQKAADTVAATSLPLVMIRKGAEGMGWAEKTDSMQETGEKIREFAGDVVGGFSPLDAIIAVLTAGAGAMGSASLKGGTVGARMAVAAPTAYRVAGAAEAAAGTGAIAEGGGNIYEGVREGDYSKAALGALQTGLGAFGVRSGKSTFNVPGSQAAKNAARQIEGEKLISDLADARASGSAEAIDAAVAALEQHPDGLKLAREVAGQVQDDQFDSLVQAIQLDARFGGSLDSPLAYGDAVRHARNLTPEMRESVLGSRVAPKDRDLLTEQLAAREEAGRRTRAMLDGTPSPDDTLETKLLRHMRAARGINAETEALRQAERSRRAGLMDESASGAGSLEELAAAQKQLAGEMPRSETAMPTFDYTDLDKAELKRRIDNSGLEVHERVRAAKVLTDMIGGNPVPPVQSDIDLLSRILGVEVAREVAKAPRGGFAKRLLSIPRSIMASADFSAPGRQGFVAVMRHPIRGAQAFKRMFGAGWSQESYDSLVDGFIQDPLYTMARDSGLQFQSVASRRRGGMLAGGGEDWVVDEAVEKLPFVRGSNRAYNAFLDKMRFDIFKDHVEKLTKVGINPVANKDIFDAYAKIINTSTGRGDLAKVVENNIELVSQVFWSPRMMAARLALINPRYYRALPAPVRAEAVRTMVSATAGAVGLLTLMQQAGAKVSWDPRSSDFGKARFGDTRYSLMGGQESYIVALARALSSEYVTKSGQVRDLSGEGPDPDRLKMVLKFLRGKLAPIPGFIVDAAAGSDFAGRKFDWTDEGNIVEYLTPMVMGDVIETMKGHGFAEPGYKEMPGYQGLDWPASKTAGDAAGAFAKAIPAIFGIGTQTYGDRVPSAREKSRIRREEAAKNRRRNRAPLLD